MAHQSQLIIFTLLISSAILVVLTESRAAHPRLGLSPTFNLTKAIATSKANCTMGKVDIIDECGLMQGFSFRFQEALYPTNHESLLKDCKRQTDSLRCLKIYAKCLPPLTEGILMSMIGNRSKYNKKLCTETPSDVSRRFLEMNKCMQKSGLNIEKGVKAEENSIGFSESIVKASSKLSFDDRLKYSCCSVSQVKKEFMDATLPACAQHTQTFGDLVDSYLADTVSLICPNFESSTSSKDCDKLTKLEQPKQLKAKYFVRPILQVIDLLKP